MMQIYNQQREYDCLLAGIATFLQKPIEDIFPEEFRQHVEEKKGTHGDDVDKAFEMAGLTKNVDYWTVSIPPWSVAYTIRDLLRGRRAFLQVRSLNNKDSFHLVYYDGKDLHDPSNKQQYRWLNQCFPEYVWVFNEVMPL